MEISATEPSFNSISTIISRYEKRNASSLISQCKTFAYSQSIQARREAQLAKCDDALLLSTNNEICCGSTSNLIVRRNKEWLTPKITSGCLPGIMRQQGLNNGLFKEATLKAKPEKEDNWLLINSLGCRPINNVNNQNLQVWENPKDLWFSLLNVS